MPNFDGNFISLSSRLEKKIAQLKKTQAVDFLILTFMFTRTFSRTFLSIYSQSGRNSKKALSI
jgi:hypothetical protein